MRKNLFLIFNHRLTLEQAANARSSLGVVNMVELPENLKPIWEQIPPDLAKLEIYLEPIKGWLLNQAGKGDHVLIQGDLGACYILVNFAFANDLVPVYSTTERQAREVHDTNGDVELTHKFRHVAFRRYERTADDQSGGYTKG